MVIWMEKWWFLAHPRPGIRVLLTQPSTADPHMDIRPTKLWVGLCQLGEFVWILVTFASQPKCWYLSVGIFLVSFSSGGAPWQKHQADPIRAVLG